ncbi:MAG: hypothetical protein PHE15_02880 [Dehalococcoidales bacterium]|nr:hypothetical protein [Dehalococcoidales bacterium]
MIKLVLDNVPEWVTSWGWQFPMPVGWNVSTTAAREFYIFRDIAEKNEYPEITSGYTRPDINPTQFQFSQLPVISMIQIRLGRSVPYYFDSFFRFSPELLIEDGYEYRISCPGAEVGVNPNVPSLFIDKLSLTPTAPWEEPEPVPETPSNIPIAPVPSITIDERLNYLGNITITHRATLNGSPINLEIKSIKPVVMTSENTFYGFKIVSPAGLVNSLSNIEMGHGTPLQLSFDIPGYDRYTGQYVSQWVYTGVLWRQLPEDQAFLFPLRLFISFVHPIDGKVVDYQLPLANLNVETHAPSVFDAGWETGFSV